MKRKYLTLVIVILSIATLFFVVYRISKKPPVAAPEKPKQPMNVTVQSAAASRTRTLEIQYPAAVVGDQEVKVTAKTSGTAQEVNYELGQKVASNATLVKIDDTGNNLDVGDEGFRSAAVQQSQLSVDQYEEQLKTAKKTYEKLNNAYQTQKKNSSLTKTVSKAQLIAAKGQAEVYEVQLESARIGLKGGLDNHLIISPISGYITSKSIAAGDSIALGQQLYTISKTDKLKFQFFVDQDQLAKITEGQPVKITLGNEQTISATIENIAPDADAVTKRFLVEAFPDEQNLQILSAGTVVTISFSITETPQNPGDLILPLAAITIGQNESYLFLAENNRAKKVKITVVRVAGDSAEIKGELTSDAQIIINGSKLVSDGDQVVVNK
jgi:HlyD family secretion protein